MKPTAIIPSNDPIGLFQFLQSSHGVTRREFMDMIQKQAIRHADTIVTDVGYQVNIGDHISITLEDKSQADITISPLRHKKTVMVVFNKPTGYVVSKEDPHNKTIFELLPKSRRQDFYPIGRLDKDSRGLLLLTNQPSLVDQYLHPRHQLNKIYEVKTDKPMTGADCLRAKRGLLVDHDGKARSKDNEWNLIPKISKKKSQPHQTPRFVHRNEQERDEPKAPKTFAPPEWVELLSCHDVRTVSTSKGYFVRIILLEGKNRHIRRLLKALGYRVTELTRISFGPYKLATIKSWRYMIQKVM